MTARFASATAKRVEQLIGKRGGGEWAFRALDPCAENPYSERACKIPDQTSSSTVALNMRTDFIIPAPSDKKWDCMIVSLPFGEVPMIHMVKESTSDEWDLATAPFKHVHNYPSLVYGRVKANHGSGAFQAVTEGPSFGQLGDQYRATYKGFSIVHIANDLTNEGMVYAGQISMPPSSKVLEVRDADDTERNINNSFTQLSVAKIPYNISALIASCPGYTRTKAKEGVYIANKFVNAAHKYTSTDWVPIIIGAQPSATTSTNTVEVSFVDEQKNRQLTTLLADSVAGETLTVSGYDNTQVGVVIFEGLNPLSSLDVKLRGGFEAVPAPSSAWFPFATESPMTDNEALEEFYSIQSRLPDAYPERYNSWGALIPLLANVASGVVGWGVERIRTALNQRYGPKPQYIEESVD
jgi:hypothetical protein